MPVCVILLFVRVVVCLLVCLIVLDYLFVGVCVFLRLPERVIVCLSVCVVGGFYVCAVLCVCLFFCSFNMLLTCLFVMVSRLFVCLF